MPDEDNNADLRGSMSIISDQPVFKKGITINQNGAALF